MPDLIAQGPQPDQRWRRKLLPAVPQTIGRQAGEWSTPWDDRISRQHVAIVYAEGELHVEMLPGALNPVFFHGRKADRFGMRPGEHFVISETTFSLVDQQVHVSLDVPPPSGERTFTAAELRRRPFREADKRIDALSRLPDIISGSPTDRELHVRLVSLLLGGIEQATAAAVVAVADANDSPVAVLHWDRRILAEAEFRPSERLIRQAVGSGESVAHVWTDNASPSPADKKAAYTLGEGTDWAVCVPVASEACKGWALYVTGALSSDFATVAQAQAEHLRDDAKFMELVTTTLGGLRQSRLLTTRQASLKQFFSPLIAEAISQEDPERVLAPRQVDATVMFCDLRGFTRESERSADDLFGLLRRVSEALGVMTHHILEQGGVVGDFHGDAAMGFWGWPMPQPNAIARARQAALNIRASFLAGSCSEEEPPLGAFRVGIGIASGPAVAGKIGTVDQVKVTAFGPVVNLAARLESMTRIVGVSILIDPPTAEAIGATVSPEICRVRRLARVHLVGLERPIDVSELLPPARECTEVSDGHLAAYQAALNAFEAGDWQFARTRLGAIETSDPAIDFLASFMERQGGAPPLNWDGAISLRSK